MLKPPSRRRRRPARRRRARARAAHGDRALRGALRPPRRRRRAPARALRRAGRAARADHRLDADPAVPPRAAGRQRREDDERARRRGPVQLRAPREPPRRAPPPRLRAAPPRRPLPPRDQRVAQQGDRRPPRRGRDDRPAPALDRPARRDAPQALLAPPHPRAGLSTPGREMLARALVEGQEIPFHPNILFRGPLELWATGSTRRGIRRRVDRVAHPPPRFCGPHRSDRGSDALRRGERLRGRAASPARPAGTLTVVGSSGERHPALRVLRLRQRAGLHARVRRRRHRERHPLPAGCRRPDVDLPDPADIPQAARGRGRCARTAAMRRSSHGSCSCSTAATMIRTSGSASTRSTLDLGEGIQQPETRRPAARAACSTSRAAAAPTPSRSTASRAAGCTSTPTSARATTASSAATATTSPTAARATTRSHSSAGNDQHFGDGGDDNIRGGPGNDVEDGGPGDDQIGGRLGPQLRA